MIPARYDLDQSPAFRSFAVLVSTARMLRTCSQLMGVRTTQEGNLTAYEVICTLQAYIRGVVLSLRVLQQP